MLNLGSMLNFGSVCESMRFANRSRECFFELGVDVEVFYDLGYEEMFINDSLDLQKTNNSATLPKRKKHMKDGNAKFIMFTLLN